MAKGYTDLFLQQIQIRPYGQKVSPQKLNNESSSLLEMSTTWFPIVLNKTAILQRYKSHTPLWFAGFNGLITSCLYQYWQSNITHRTKKYQSKKWLETEAGWCCFFAIVTSRVLAAIVCIYQHALSSWKTMCTCLLTQNILVAVSLSFRCYVRTKRVYRDI